MVRFQISIRHSDARRIRALHASPKFPQLEDAPDTLFAEQRRHLPETEVRLHARLHELCAQPARRRHDSGRPLLSYVAIGKIRAGKLTAMRVPRRPILRLVALLHAPRAMPATRAARTDCPGNA